jgi:prepilin-type N-terminal cleavage/methylation domain-containing protein
MKRAFTLIELLVVIAIIAILAAILFPVFAQAKAAAKKASDLSQFKQLGLAVNIYSTDHDDVLPLAYSAGDGGVWYTGFIIETPADWIPGNSQAYYAENQVHWANSTFPYTKNGSLLATSNGKERLVAGAPYATAAKAVYTTNLNFNGLLNGWSATAITSPSQLPLFSQNRGTMNIKGFGSSNPVLDCDNNGPCTFQPSTPTCDDAVNGAWSSMFFSNDYSQWVHGRGHITVQADSSAKWRSMNGPVNGASDYRTMYWTRFNATGASVTEWQDTNFCHTMLFMPDFDFQNFGSPIEF